MILEINSSSSQEKVFSHKEICEKLNEIYVKKNHDYGNSFGNQFKKRGPVISIVHIEEKLNRFEELTIGGKKAKVGESVIDTLMDLANYTILTIMELHDETSKGELV